MKTSLILVPYHLGIGHVSMGLGPERILQAGINDALSSQGHDVKVETIRRQTGAVQDELATIAEINTILAGHVRKALKQGRFPLVLAGNCNACLGTLAGIDAQTVGIVWLDAHGDFNTPETSLSGFLDGMPLAMAAGLCHRTVLRISGSPPIHGAHIIHVGGRDFDRGEQERLVEHQILVVPASHLRQVGLAMALGPALAALRSRVQHVYLHVDLDVLDPAEGRANQHTPPDGLSRRDLKGAIRMIGAELNINAAALTAYDPAWDESGHALGAGLQVIHTIVEAAATPQSTRGAVQA